MDPQQEAKIAALLIAQAQQLQDKAGQVGVTAFCGRPSLRERPNERFLTNTLRNVSSANRRVEERSMWAARKLQQGLDDKGGGRRGKGGSGRGQEQAPQQRWRAGRGLGQEWDELDHQQHARSGSEGLTPERQHSSRHRDSSRSRSRSRSREQRPERSPGWDEEPEQRQQWHRREQHRQEEGRDGSRRKRSRSRSSSRSSSQRPSGHSPRGAAAAPVAVTSGRHGDDRSSGDASASSSSSGSETSGGTSSCSWSDGDARPHLEPGHKVRGRGSVGSAVAVAGPYLAQPPQQPGGALLAEPAMPGRGAVGPERPRWLPGAAGGIPTGAAGEVEGRLVDRRQKLVPNTQFLKGLLTAQAGGRRQASGEQGARSEDSSGSSRERSRSTGRHKSSKSSKRKRKDSSKDKKRRRKEGKRKGSSSKRDKKDKKRRRRSPDGG